jgi:Ni,Fe-hydrogenase III large subunit
MNSGEANQFEARYNARVAKIREAAAIALKELDQLRSGGPMAREAFDAEVARITQEKLHPYGCDLVVHSMGNSVTRFLIKVQSTGRTYDLIKSFFHRDNGR